MSFVDYFATPCGSNWYGSCTEPFTFSSTVLTQLRIFVCHQILSKDLSRWIRKKKWASVDNGKLNLTTYIYFPSGIFCPARNVYSDNVHFFFTCLIFNSVHCAGSVQTQTILFFYLYYWTHKNIWICFFSQSATKWLQKQTLPYTKLTANASYVFVLTVMRQYPESNWTSIEKNSTLWYTRTNARTHT